MKRILLGVICFLMVFVSGCQNAPVHVIAQTTPSPANSPTPCATPEPTPIKTTTTDPTPTPVPQPTQITLMVAGDLLCLYSQLNAARQDGEYQFDYCFGEVKEIISSADLAIGNLETLVAEGYAYTGRAPTQTITETAEDGTETVTTVSDGNTKINAPESYLGAVIACGFDVLTNANNHIYDHGADGIVKTVSKLDEYNVYHTGAYATEEEKTPLIIDVEGINIAIFAYTTILNNHPGNSSAYMVDRYSEELVSADIAAAKEAGADYIIVCMHWGNEHTHNPTRSQKNMAEYIANAGADIILGSHSHCTQPIETIETERGSVPVIYSLGNFISSMAKTMHNDSVILRLVLEKNYVEETTSLISFTYIPTLCTDTSTGRFVVLPASLESIAGSGMASALENSRERTIDVLGDTVATPE
ncbi:MAG: CapA family protein [Eubacteriales bacterium]|nr:CapA family protein [Eubacteriales bacterium]